MNNENTISLTQLEANYNNDYIQTPQHTVFELERVVFASHTVRKCRTKRGSLKSKYAHGLHRMSTSAQIKLPTTKSHYQI